MDTKITFDLLNKGIPTPKIVRKHVNENLNIEPPFGKLPLVIQVVSKRGSGKSFALGKLLTENNLIGRKRFENIYYFNPNHWSDPSWNKVKLRTRRIFTGEYDEDDKPIYKHIPIDYQFNKMDYDIVNEILQEQTDTLAEVSDEDRLPQILVVVDDIVLPPKDMESEDNPISRIVRNGRHYGITLIYSIQRMKQLVSTVLRDNTDILMFWVNSNSNMLESIHDYYFKENLPNEVYHRLITKLRVPKTHNFILLNMKDCFDLYVHMDKIGFGKVHLSKGLKK